MKAIVNTGPNQLTLQERPCPEPGPGQVRIRTSAVGICATDLEMIAGWERTGFPSVPGHEWAGIIDATGPDIDSDLVGQCCVAENVLTDGGEVGFEHPGAYGEYFLTEARRLHLLPADFPILSAALIEPLAVVVRALKRLRFSDQRRALISGDGPIGLLALMMLRSAGVDEIAVIGGRSGRLTLARDLGATATFNFFQLSSSLVSSVKGHFGASVPNIIETSGSPVGINNALQLLAREGQLLLIGDYKDSHASFPWNLMIHREIELIGSNASSGAWNEAVRLATNERLPLKRLISHTFPTARFEEAFSLVRSQRDDVIKVVMEW